MVPLRVLLQNSWISCWFSKDTTTPAELKDCSKFSMVFLRSCVLSISNIVSYSYIGCKELEGFVLVFHWGPFGLLCSLLYLIISFFTFTNSFSSFIIFTDSFETIAKFFFSFWLNSKLIYCFYVYKFLN